ncbi:unnamed protein product, partial [Ectocarpus fasciculatus]
MDVIHSVKLLVYDLSNGMAANMSEAVLGQRIDGVWHTGVLVYGREYFFGAGIKFLPEGEFAQSHGLLPVQVLPMGETQVDSDMFHEYLHSISPRFSPGTYDILNNNCNNFSNECTHFLTGCGIPTHIIDLPRLAMATPAGALLRPMIEGLQNGVRSDGSSTPLSAFGTNFTPPAAAAAP